MRKTSVLSFLFLAVGAAGQDAPPAREPFFRTLIESRSHNLKQEFDNLGTAFDFSAVTTDR